jgi:hypothetical protein
MAYTGQVIENPVIGERISFRQTAADTNGELLEFDVALTPDGHVPGMHVHPAQEERFEVRPALEMERLFETAVSLAEEGRVTSKGMPKPLDLALFVREFKDEVRGPGTPGWAQRAALAPLAWIARRRGRAERYVAPKPAYA